MKLKLIIIDFELSRRQKQLAAALMATLLLTVAGVAFAGVPKVFVKGDTLTAADLNTNFSALDSQLTTTAGDVTALGMQLGQASTERLKTGTQVSLPSGPSGPLTPGPVNPATSQMLWQSASSVEIADAAGNVIITYPSAFPNGVLSSVVMNGDSNFGAITFGLIDNSKSSMTVRAFNSAGAPLANTIMRFNWIAIGW